MPTTTGLDRNREAARRLVLRLAGGTACVERVAEVSTSVFAALCERLAVLVGESGTAAVLDRALEEHAHDGARTPGGGSAELLIHVADFVRRNGPRAADAAAHLVATFVVMISTLIGETLTSQVLHDLWPDAFVAEAEPVKDPA